MKNNRKFKLYGDFEKVEKLEDGTVKVSGIASSETVDGAGEVVTASAMKAAIPDYMAFGAVREMHQPIAAGAAISIETGDDGVTRFEALVVDEGSIKKVLSDPPVLKGFSIGGKVTGRDDLNKSVITGLKLNEISLVDRPCNPDAKLAIAKLEDAEDDGDEPTQDELRKVLYNAIDELLANLPVPPAADVLAMAEKLAKGEGLQDDTEKLAKLDGERTEALAKVELLEADLKKAQDEITTLKAMPAPPKGVKVVAKGQDITQPEEAEALKKQAEEIQKLPPEQQAAALIKVIHGGR